MGRTASLWDAGCRRDKGLLAWARGNRVLATRTDWGDLGRLRCVDKILKNGKRDPQEEGLALRQLGNRCPERRG